MPKRNVPPLQTPRVSLRLLSEGDLPLTLAWRNKDRVRSCFVTSRVISEDEHRAWFASYLQRDNDFDFVILDRESGRVVGQVAIYEIDWERRTATFGRLMIGEDDALGKGLASEATRAAIAFSLGTLAMVEVRLEVFAANHRAIALYEKCGFRVCGERDGLVRMKLDRGAAA